MQLSVHFIIIMIQSFLYIYCLCKHEKQCRQNFAVVIFIYDGSMTAKTECCHKFRELLILSNFIEKIYIRKGQVNGNILKKQQQQQQQQKNPQKNNNNNNNEKNSSLLILILLTLSNFFLSLLCRS